MRLLAVSTVPPWPTEGGLALRAARFLEALANDWEIDLVVCAPRSRTDGGAAEAPRPPAPVPLHRLIEVESDCQLSPVPPPGSGPSRAALARTVVELLEGDRPAAALLWPGAEFLLPALAAGVPVVIDRCDSATLERLRGLRRSPTTLLRAARYAWYERRLVRLAAATVASGPADARFLGRLGGRSVVVIPNGVGIPASLPPRAPAPTVVFTGTLDYPPNVDAARFLVRTIWPLVRASVPRARLVIAGRRPSDKVKRLRAPDIEVQADPDDMVDVLGRAWVAVAPMRTGTGIKNKVLEAWAAGCPVVMTSIAANGLVEEAAAPLIADRPEPFASLVADLLSRPEHRDAVGARCRDAARLHHTWSGAARSLSALLRQAAGQPG